MAPRSTGRSTTTGSRTAGRRTPARTSIPREDAEETFGDLEDEVQAEPETVAEPEPAPEPPKSPEPKANVMGGMIERKWSGYPNWLCPRCGMDTFDKQEADTHTCKGRVVKPYEGDDK